MFMGEYQHSIDDKGRIIIPAKFREDLGEKFIVTRGLDNCLFVYPLVQWKVLEEKIKELPTSHADTRAFVRMFFSGAVEAELDKQGRVVIPQHLREHARIERDAYVIGVSTKVEIWSKESWENYSNQAQQSYEAIAEKIIDIGI
ncbi:MAG TPA: division/cell wall cluster transcriptional repressor MraZ [Bacillota bacterium]|jgi:MraZ protein|nr:division/cell wall cluster transcriptional repressor MraZ [Bacillota bacterium]HOL08530.1 division/cell wall cluster transcriptional repressor MraZ [Bacillota bacterium]HPO96989.1 division/cell wall cluster transcriptional repressor MraZ [Bacillota bacterium]